jgi:hypothetical protein
MLLRVPPTLTPASGSQVLRALYDALPPSAGRREAANILAAQSALETARWSRMYGWNTGNVTIGANVLPVLMWTRRGLDFAVYGDLATGAADQVAYLAKHSGGRALAQAAAGDVAGFTQSLQAMGYAGPAGDYAAYEVAIARGADALAPLPLAPASSIFGGGILAAAAVGAVVAFLWV